MANTEVEILLVENDIRDAEMTIRALKKSKIVNHVVHLKDGVAALDFLFGTGEFDGRNTSRKPKIILLDLKMPKVDGFEVLRKVKADKLTSKIPVVILTSSKENRDIETCYLLGANSYIVKKIDFVGFSKTMDEVGMYWLLFNQGPT